MEFGILHSSSTIAIGRAVREFRVQVLVLVVLVLVQSGLHLYFVSQSVFYFFSSPTGSRVHAIIVQPLFNCVEIPSIQPSCDTPIAALLKGLWKYE